MDKKNLLVFAHYLEAIIFIEEMKMKSFPFPLGKAYENENYYLLITGEGVQSATQKLTYFLALNSNRISSLINMGISGSVDSKYLKGSIHSIRTVYREVDGEMQFTSFSTADESSTTDMVTTHQRVLDSKKGKYLQCFAPLVDRELWAIGSVSKVFKLPIYSYKLISDSSDEQIKNLCIEIIDDAKKLSQKLFSYFKETAFYHHKESKIISVDKKEQLDELFDKNLFNDYRFHFTVSSSRNYIKLIKALSIKLQTDNKDLFESLILEDIDLERIISEENSRKKRTIILLNKLSEILNPFTKKIRTKLKELTGPLEESGCQIKYSPNFEKDDLFFEAKIDNSISFKKLKSEIERLPYDRIIEVLNGKLDV